MVRAAVLSAIALGLAGAAHAAQSTGQFGVSATVVAACTISGSDLAFGNLNVLSGSNVDASSNLTVTCTNGSAYNVGLSAGANGASTAARKMLHSGNVVTLDYGLFSDASRSVNWDDIGEAGVVAGTGSGEAQTIPVYGRIPSGQTSAIAGAYSDTVVATVDF